MLNNIKSLVLHYLRGAATGAIAALLAGAPNPKALVIAVLMGALSGIEQTIATGGKQ